MMIWLKLDEWSIAQRIMLIITYKQLGR